MTVTYDAVTNPGSANFNATGPTPPAGTGTGYLPLVAWGSVSEEALTYDTATYLFAGDSEGGAGTWGANQGTRHASAYWTTAAISGVQTWTNPGGDGSTSMTIGYIVRAIKSLTYWVDPEVSWVADNVAGSGFSGVCNRDQGFQTGDVAVLFFVANSDAVNPAGITCSIPGTSQGTGTTAIITSPFGTGHNARVTIRYMSITGTSTGPATISSSTDFTGTVLLIRLRDTNTAPVTAPVLSVSTDGVAEPWIRRTIDGSGSTYPVGSTILWEDVTVAPNGSIVFDDPTDITTEFIVSPTNWVVSDWDIRLTIDPPSGPPVSLTVTRTVNRSQEMISAWRSGAAVDVPLKITRP